MDRQLNTAVVKLIRLEVMFLSHQSFLGFVFRHQVTAIFFAALPLEMSGNV